MGAVEESGPNEPSTMTNDEWPFFEDEDDFRHHQRVHRRGRQWGQARTFDISRGTQSKCQMSEPDPIGILRRGSKLCFGRNRFSVHSALPRCHEVSSTI